MKQSPKRRKTSLYFIHKIGHNAGALLFIFNRYLIKILLIVGIIAGIVYMSRRVEDYQNDDTKVVAFGHAHPDEMGKGKYAKKGVVVPASSQRMTYRPPVASAKPAASAPKSTPSSEQWKETTDFSPDMKPFLGQDDKVPRSFLQSEVRARLEEIRMNVLKKR